MVATRIERWIATGMRDLHAADDAIRSELRRDRTERGDHRGGQPGSLQLRAYRCAAAIAGPSGGGEDDSVDALRLQVRRDLAAHLPRLDHRGADAGRDDVALIQRAEFMRLLELAQR